ncbi:MAG: DUF342 domain-containing protein, partial [Calditrichaeota bacterium]|nr:DUF342 domain-containing protein [Calditrichota bacterium]
MEIFRLQIDSPKMNAYLSIIKKAALLGNITPETVMNYLHNSGIVFGINEEAIHKMLDRKLWNKQIKVAVGQPPVRGEDGHEKFYFKTDEKFTPKVHTDGSVDFKDLKIAQNVSEGKIIAERIPPTKGISGIDIYGKEVIAENGIEARLVAGDNTEFKDEKQNVLISTVDGSIKLRFGNTVVVDTVFEVVKDVDFSTGNLDVTGDVNVRGSVLSGFNVKATGNITVNGIIEDAIIEAGGDVMVRMGFTGTGKGVISADGQVVLKYINNQTVKAEEIFIGEQA